MKSWNWIRNAATAFAKCRNAASDGKRQALNFLKNCAINTIVGISLISTSGCFYLFAERNGELFPSTRDILNARQNYFILPTAGGVIFTAGILIPYVGPVVLCPPGIALHLVELCVVAPAYDIVCMPYDLYQRPAYLAKCRREEEVWQARTSVRKNLDAALDDGRCLSPSNTVYREALGERLGGVEHDELSAAQVSRIVSAIRGDESLLLDMHGVSSQLAMEDADREWFVRKAIELKRGGRGEDGDAVAASLCRSRKLSDAQYDELAGAGFSAGMLASSKRERERYAKSAAGKAAR